MIKQSQAKARSRDSSPKKRFDAISGAGGPGRVASELNMIQITCEKSDKNEGESFAVSMQQITCFE